MVDFLNVVAVFKMLDKEVHVLDIVLVFECNVVLGNLVFFCGLNLVTELFESFANCVKVVGSVVISYVSSSEEKSSAPASRPASMSASSSTPSLVFFQKDYNTLIVEHI